MNVRNRDRAAACLLLFLLALVRPPEVAAQETLDAERRQRVAENPAGVDLTVRIENGRRRFSMGEVIRLQLSFSSRIPDRYRLELRDYDRSGRLNVDRPIVAPSEATIDPLEDYFHSGIFGFIGGGISRPPTVLGQDPVAVSMVLNEHVRFERPGRFRLFVVSGRLHSVGEFSPLPVTSNVVDVDIVPADPAWEQRRIAESTRALRDGGDGAAVDAACRFLRFLGTTAAVDAILDHYPVVSRSCRYAFSLGLRGAPPAFRAHIAREMTLRLTLPDYPVRSSYLGALAFLNWMARHPDHAASAGTPLASSEARRSAHDAKLDESFEDLADALPAKEGRALAISAMTLIRHRGLPVPETLRRKAEVLRPRLPAVFDLLADKEQHTLLDYNWGAIRHPGLLPVLRRIVDRPAGNPRRREPVRDAALRRLYEMAPAEGRRRILREIRSGDSTLDVATLGMLPDPTLPELESELLTQLETAPDADLPGRLLARYASSAVLPGVVRWLRASLDGRACRPLHALLAYSLRLSPDDGLPLVREALSRRSGTGCYRSVLKNVADLHSHPGLAALATEALEDADPEVVRNAAETLQDHGTAEAKGALWNQLTQRYAQAVRQGRDPADRRLSELSRSGWRTQRALADALADGQGWRLDLDELSRLRDHVHEADRQQLTTRMRQAMLAPVIRVGRIGPSERLDFWVEPYHPGSLTRLQQKLLQFPAGTRFGWYSSLPPDREEEEAELFALLQRFLRRHGMDLAGDGPPGQR